MLAQRHQFKGKFILFEGLSGSGKSTQAQLLCDRLVQDATDQILLNREPTQGVFGRMIRALIERKPVPTEWFLEVGYQCAGESKWEEFLSPVRKIARGESLEEMERQQLFVLDRFDDITRTIVPALKDSKIVVQDRFDLSTYAYYAAAHGGAVSIDDITELHRKILGSSYILPDLIFVFDMPAEHAVARLEFSGKTIDIYEQGEYLKRVREAYAFLAEQLSHETNVVLLDGMRGKEDLHEQIVDVASRQIL
ncbi:MAG: hypothetical protein AAB611_02465 [Patescibacteria group bacterium]